MLVRTVFVALRFFGYGTVFLGIDWEYLNRPWWQWLIGILVCAFGTSEYWKRPDESTAAMRLGIWAEVFAVGLWTLSTQNSLIIILLVSPVARAGVHLGWRDSALLTVCATVSIFAGWRIWSAEAWLAGVELATILGTSGYSLVLGQLLRQRDRLKRAVQVTAFEREQRVKDEERLRMAGQLHDTLGQHWTAVIRALDVAAQVSGDQRRVFIGKARNAAMDGLSAMRQATHTWNAGRQAPREWLQFVEESLARLQVATGLDVQFQSSEIDWSRFENRIHVAEVLARTVIEGATNAIRHGCARRLLITIQSDVEEMRAVIYDDGNGLKAGQGDPESGIGLTVLQHSAAETGGSIRLESTPGRGTTLLLRIPYSW